jgi:hypothetical protein
MTSAVSEPSRDGIGSRRAMILIALGVAAFGLAFAFAANDAWEDYYITLRSSRNLIEGHGLVFQPGERVHSYTSPLGTLLPAAGLWLTGSDVGALWIMRVVSVAALAAAAVLIARCSRLSGIALALTLALSVLDAKTLSFATNGMETGLWVFFAALAWHQLTTPHATGMRWLAIGFAGLMWTRPDGMIPALAMVAGAWLFGARLQPATQHGRWRWRVVAAVVVGAAIYAPWVIWAWSYYGSPVPNTIVAKATIAPGGFSLPDLLFAPLRCLIQPTALDGLFMPLTLVPGDWPEPLILIWRLLARLAVIAWLLPSVPAPARAASFATLLGGIYLQQIANFSWYFGPWTMLGGIALGGLLQAAGVAARSLSAARIGAASVMALSLGLVLATAYTARLQSRWVETHGVKALGLWLRTHAQPGDTVFLEPLGYIGYFSGLKMLDFPGLSAPEVTRLVRSGKRNFGDLITALQPTWIVLRPTEVAGYRLLENGALRDYAYVRAWDTSAEIDAVTFLPYRRAVEYGGIFLLFHRRDLAAAPTLSDVRQ